MSLELLAPSRRPAVEALWRIDAAMGDVVARSTDPRLRRIKLAWWREQVEALDSAAAPAEPRLQAVSAELLPRGISGHEIALIEPGWATLLDAHVDPHLVAERGVQLFTIIAALLGGPDPKVGDAGAFWALVSVGKRNGPELLDSATHYSERLKGVKFPMRLRGLTLLARFAAHDLKNISRPQSSKSRVMPALAHIWTGIVTP